MEKLIKWKEKMNKVAKEPPKFNQPYKSLREGVGHNPPARTQIWE